MYIISNFSSIKEFTKSLELPKYYFIEFLLK